MNIIIIGGGKVGLTLTRQLLAEGHDITLIDTHPEVIDSAVNSLDIMGVAGNGASYAIQQEAGVEKADLLIAVTGRDEVNLLCCLIAKKAGNCPTIARVRNPIYHQEASFLKESLGLAMIINPDSAAAHDISRILRCRAAMDLNPFAKGRAEITKIRISADSPLCGMTLNEFGKKGLCDVLVCAVERGDETLIPDGNYTFTAGDYIHYLATPANSSVFLNKAGQSFGGVRNCLIIGGSKCAYYLAERLISHGIQVKIVELSQERCEELSQLLPKATIIHGDGTDQNLLIEEGLESYDSVVSMTNLDEENILLSLFAGTKAPKAKLVTKINRISFDDVIRKMDIGTVVNPKNITAEYIIRFVRGRQNTMGSNIETLYRLIEGKVEAMEFIVREDSPLTENTIGELGKNGMLIDNTLIGCIIRKNRMIIPKGQDKIEKGDSVIVITAHTGLTELKKILR